MTTTSIHKEIVHKNAVDIVAHRLIENGTSTRTGTTDRNDLILDDGKTISVRGLVESGRVPLMVGTSTPDWDYVAIVTHVRYTIKRVHIIPRKDVEKFGVNAPLKNDGTSNWYINERNYRNYRDNYGVFDE